MKNSVNTFFLNLYFRSWRQLRWLFYKAMWDAGLTIKFNARHRYLDLLTKNALHRVFNTKIRSKILYITMPFTFMYICYKIATYLLVHLMNMKMKFTWYIHHPQPLVLCWKYDEMHLANSMQLCCVYVNLTLFWENSLWLTFLQKSIFWIELII